MPAKKSTLTDAERAKGIRETAREAEADNDPATLDRALRAIAQRAQASPKATPRNDRFRAARGLLGWSQY